MGGVSIHRASLLFFVIAAAASALVAVAPLDVGEELSRGIARWIVGEVGDADLLSMSVDLEPGDLPGLWRRALQRDSDSLIVVNSRYVDQRVWVELWGVASGVIVTSWSGLLAVTALSVELPAALAGLLEELGYGGFVPATAPNLDELVQLAAQGATP
ncbi:MAG: hypothetical protein GF399_05195 [Candidatus Coatesbacteria bacterium]|nr:hypothetical protein [Candidatus Coatesbacteria bacterium]